MVNEKVGNEGQIAVLIDFENVGLDTIQGLFDDLSDMGRIIIKRAYADWGNSKSQREKLFELGIEPVMIFRSPNSGKNASDIRLTIDATELLYQSTIDTFVIVSSDTDFIPLVNKLRSAGKVVIGAGRKETQSPNLVRACDRYFFLGQTEAKILPVKQSLSPLDELLLRGFKASSDEYGRVVGSKLHSTIQKLDPSFNYKAIGFATFTKLLASSPVFKVTRPRTKGDVEIELKE